MSGGIENTVNLSELDLPWAKQASIQAITYEGGMTMLRIRIREGRRFTDIEFMPEDAAKLASVLDQWAKKNQD